MASIKQLKKKINQQSFKVLRLSLVAGGNQNTKSETVLKLLDDALHFQQVSIDRINGCRGMTLAERRAEIKTVAEQFKDKETYYQKAVTSA